MSEKDVEKIVYSIISRMPVGLVIMDCRDKNIIFINDEAKKILGLYNIGNLEVLLKKHSVDLCSKVRESKAGVRIQTSYGDKIIGMSVYTITRDLKLHPVSIIFLKNISEMVREERVIREVFERDFAKKIAGAIAHEIGNPLSALKVSLRLILDNIANYEISKVRNMINSMLEEVDKVDRFLKDFLRDTRTEHVQFESVSFCEVLNEVLL